MPCLDRKKINKKDFDGIILRKTKKKREKNLDYNIFQANKNEVSSLLLSYKEKSATPFFFTEDSKLYITQREAKLIQKGIKLDRRKKKWDSISSRIINDYRYFRPQKEDFFYRKYREFLKKYTEIAEFSVEKVNFFQKAPLIKVWNMSIIGALVLGMLATTFIYRYLGSGVSAEGENEKEKTAVANVDENIDGLVLGLETEKNAQEKENEYWTKEKEEEYINQVVDYLEIREKEELERKIREMVKGYPIEKMVPYILEKDRETAIFLIAIAKKESNWGKRVPVLNSQDCYNYWGYRGKRKLMGSGGHTCFNSSRDAVDTVAKRIDWLIKNQKLDTPAEMVIWKCGSSCAATGGYESARKWISDVGYYFNKLNN